MQVFELRETLMGKYGEDSKLIYDLADQGEARVRATEGGGGAASGSTAAIHRSDLSLCTRNG